MRKCWFVVLAAVLLPAGAMAQSMTIAWTRFVDPTENAFALDVPQGWTVKGGVKRLSPVSAHQWVAAVSPDGMMQVFVGDPGVPRFGLPRANEAEGARVHSDNAPLAPGVVLSYRPGAEFARFYGPRSLAAAGCAGAVLTGTQPMPDLARSQYARAVEQARGLVVNGGFTPPPHDAGIATFTCQSGGRPLAAGVVADTLEPGAAGSWSVGVVAGYLTTPGQEPWAQAILKHVLASRQWNPQWDEATRQQLQAVLTRQIQVGAEMMALLQRQSEEFSEMLRAKGDADQAALTASHNATMAQMNAQSAANNVEFKSYQAQRSLNSWNFDAHVRNGELYRNVDTGEIFEVDRP